MQQSLVYQFCPRCGIRVENPGQNPLVCHHCDFTHYFSPVAGVVCLIGTPDGEVVLTIRARDPGRGKYGVPGGFVDPGESATDAARREVLEELGLTVTSLDYLGSYPNLYHFKGVDIPVVDLVFLCGVESWENLQLAPEEIERIEIVRPGPEHLSQMAFDSNRRGLLLFLEATRPAPKGSPACAAGVTDGTPSSGPAADSVEILTKKIRRFV